MPEFTPDQISGPTWIPNTERTTLPVALPDGTEGHAFDLRDLNATPANEPTQRVAAALNFQVQGHGSEAVVGALTAPEGFPVSLTGH